MTIIFLVFLCVATGVLAVYFFSHSGHYKIIETRTFSCPGMSGFTFQYPVFKGWEAGEPYIISGSDNKICEISLGPPYTGSSIPTISVRIISHWESGYTLKERYWFSYKMKEAQTPRGIRYLPMHLEEESRHSIFGNKKIPDTIQFEVAADRHIRISLFGIPDGSGFSCDAFWKTVVESFRVIQGKIAREQALEIARRDNEAYLNARLYAIESHEEADGWHIDYAPKNQNARGGGAPHYIINSATGAIVKKWFDR